MEKGRGREGLIARVGRVFGAADGLVCDISCYYLYIVVIFFSSNFLSFFRGHNIM